MATLLIFIALFLRLNVRANPVAENVADFQLLCQLAALAEQELTPSKTDDNGQAAYTDITALNMSTSDDAWQKLFPGTEADGNWAQKSKDYDGKDFQKDWATKWNDWNTAKATITGGAGADKWLAKHPAPKNTNTRKKVAAQLKALAERAADLYTHLVTVIKTEGEATIPAVNTALRQALYGRGVTAKKAEEGKTVKSKNTYDDSCKTTSPALSLYGDMLCICGLAAGGSSDECFKTGIGIGWNTDATTALTQVQKKCPKAAAQALTADAVEAAITAFGARVRHGTQDTNTHHFLGKQSAGTCNGATGQLCVVYDKLYTTGTGEGHLAIPWIGQLRAAAGKLREHETAVADIKETTAALKQLQAMAWTIYSIPDNDEAPAQQVTPKEQPQKTQQACDQHKSDKTTCENSDKCKWEGKSDTEGDCKPKDGIKQTNTAGDGAAGANSEGKKCSEKTKQEECKDGCKWDGTECKDSSFLLNKKLALTVVSAAIAALLF